MAKFFIGLAVVATISPGIRWRPPASHHWEVFMNRVRVGFCV